MAKVTIETRTLPAVEFGPENPLPMFRAKNPDMNFAMDATLPDDDRKYIGWRTAFRVLPYRMQDNYTRQLKPRKYSALVVQNDYICATFLPEIGGRMISLVDKQSNTELLEPVKSFQPANIALRNAWIAGGVEWNTAQLGHHYLTCSPVNSAVVKGSDGDEFVRLYAWDRVKGIPYQLDVHLPDDSHFLHIHVRVINLHDEELPMYWWSNIAAPQAEGRRVLVSTDSTIHHTDNILAVADLPVINGMDMSYTTNLQYSNEFYFRIPKTARPWVACVDESGKGLLQTSTSRLCGRKLFAWGTSSGGQRWQRHLLGEGRAYLEVQAGLARTQLESKPMPAKTEWSWTEAYGMIQGDPTALHSSQWKTARQSVDDQLAQMIPMESMDALHAKYDEEMQLLPDRIVTMDEGWSSLERLRQDECAAATRIPSEFVFSPDALSSEQQQWMTLLKEGVLQERSPEEGPGCYMTQPEWCDLLEQSVANGKSDHWLGWLHLGVMRCEALDDAGAREAWMKSIERKPTSWAYRNLAVLELRNEPVDPADRQRAALEWYRKAWEAGPYDVAIAVEYSQVMVDADLWDELAEFMRVLPESMRYHERMLIAAGKTAMHFNKLDDVDEILDHEYASIREGETTLSELWFSLQALRISEREGVPNDGALMARVKRELTPPQHLDFRMAKDNV